METVEFGRRRVANVIPLRSRYARAAGDVTPPAAPQPSSGVPWSLIALFAVGYGAYEGIKHWSGANNVPVLLPGARLMREPSRISRRNPNDRTAMRSAVLLAVGAAVGGVATYGFVNMRQNQAAIDAQNATLGTR